jgi:hypothetical protein
LIDLSSIRGLKDKIMESPIDLSSIKVHLPVQNKLLRRTKQRSGYK